MEGGSPPLSTASQRKRRPSAPAASRSEATDDGAPPRTAAWSAVRPGRRPRAVPRARPPGGTRGGRRAVVDGDVERRGSSALSSASRRAPPPTRRPTTAPSAAPRRRDQRPRRAFAPSTAAPRLRSARAHSSWPQRAAHASAPSPSALGASSAAPRRGAVAVEDGAHELDVAGGGGGVQRRVAVGVAADDGVGLLGGEEARDRHLAGARRGVYRRLGGGVVRRRVGARAVRQQDLRALEAAVARRVVQRPQPVAVGDRRRLAALQQPEEPRRRPGDDGATHAVRRVLRRVFGRVRRAWRDGWRRIGDLRREHRRGPVGRFVCGRRGKGEVVGRREVRRLWCGRGQAGVDRAGRREDVSHFGRRFPTKCKS